MAVEADTTVRTLEMLRAGRPTEAVEHLEQRLDGALTTLAASLAALPESGRDPRFTQLLKRAQEYRARFPHTNNWAEVEKLLDRGTAPGK